MIAFLQVQQSNHLFQLRCSPCINGRWCPHAWTFTGHKHKDQGNPVSDGQLLYKSMMMTIFVSHPIVAEVLSCSWWKWSGNPRVLLCPGQVHHHYQKSSWSLELDCTDPWQNPLEWCPGRKQRGGLHRLLQRWGRREKEIWFWQDSSAEVNHKWLFASCFYKYDMQIR